KTLFTFIETEPGYPLPIKEWFYPGRRTGLEFIYPKQQAMEIAQHAREPIKAADAGDLHDLASITVEAIGPVGSHAPVTTSAANITKTETTTALEKPSVTETEPTGPVEQPSVENKADIAQNESERSESVSSSTTTLKTEPEVERKKPSEPPEQASTTAQKSSTESRELPRTAGELPVIALIGVLLLGAGLGMKVLS